MTRTAQDRSTSQQTRSSHPLLGTTTARPIHGLIKEISAFGVIGAMGLVVDLSVFNLLFDAGQITAKCFSTAAAMTVTYLGNKYISFARRSQSTVRREAITFIAINLATLAISVAILALFEYPLHLKGDQLVMNAANLATIAAGTAFRFWAYKRYVFPQDQGLHRPTLQLATMDPSGTPHQTAHTLSTSTHRSVATEA